LLDFQNNRAKYALVALPSIFLLTVFSLLFLPTVLAEEILDTSENQEISLGEEIVNFEQPLSLIEIFERSESGVVSIFVNKSSDFGETSGEGSGFVYDKTGNIITNNHVVENAERISVTFVNGISYRAEIVGTDPYADLAVIKVDVGQDKLNPLSMGDSSNLKVGAQVTAIGNPFGLSGSMTSGIISQLGRTLPAQGTNFSIPDIIQTDAAINPGNSGGPLLDMNGDVIGINTAIYSNGGDFSGVGFSIPSNIALKIVPTIIKEGEYLHPWIGITTLNITPDLAEVLSLENAKGVLVMTVVKDSPADKANLRGSSNTTILEGVEYQVGGDIIVSVDEKEVRQIDDILATLQRDKGVGDELKLEVIRDGKTMDIVVNLEKRPDT
jgi:S1-C subfamily serine protease